MLTWFEMYGAPSACSYELRSSYASSAPHVGVTGGSGTGSSGHDGWKYSSSESDPASCPAPPPIPPWCAPWWWWCAPLGWCACRPWRWPAPDVGRSWSALVRVESEGGTQRSFGGSLPASCTSDTSGVSNPTVNCEGDALPCSALGKIPCVRRCRFAFERTAKLFVHVGIGHLNAVGERVSERPAHVAKNKTK